MMDNTLKVILGFVYGQTEVVQALKLSTAMRSGILVTDLTPTGKGTMGDFTFWISLSLSPNFGLSES